MTQMDRDDQEDVSGVVVGKRKEPSCIQTDDVRSFTFHDKSSLSLTLEQRQTLNFSLIVSTMSSDRPLSCILWTPIQTSANEMLTPRNTFWQLAELTNVACMSRSAATTAGYSELLSAAHVRLL
jgi:hypothetical protein